MAARAPWRAFLVALFLLAGCAETPPEEGRLVLREVAFAALPGWASDHQEAALEAFRRSCTAIAKLPAEQAMASAPELGRVADWQGVCGAAAQIPAGDAVARAFFEAAFRPYAATDGSREEGLFTGYYEPELRGSRRRSAEFAVPLYRRPPELVSIDLGRFRPAWRGERTAGRVDNGTLVPFATRAEIEAGALAGRGLELLFVADPVEAFFLQVQGSGQVVIPDGAAIRVGYDGQNGHPYVAIGRLLAERGIMPREQVSLDSLRAWLRAHPEEGRRLMQENPSYVFFREVAGEGPIGTEGVALTPGRSLAVDRSFLPLGAPVWLDAEAPPAVGEARLQRLLVAQDTGGAIRGPVRGDVFWGHGAAAERRAGGMRSRGRYWILVPRAAAPHVALSP